MALTPAKMKRVDMVVLERDVHRVTALLGRLGMLHLLEVKPEETGAGVTRINRSAELEQCRMLLMRLNGLREHLGLKELPVGAEDKYENVDAIARDVAEMEGQIGPLMERRLAIEAQSEELQDELGRLQMLGVFSAPISSILNSPFLHFAVGTIRQGDLNRLREEARGNTVLLPRPGSGDLLNLVAITSKKGRFALETLLKQHNFNKAALADIPKGTPAEVIRGLEHQMETIREEQKRIGAELRRLADSYGARISGIAGRLEVETALLEASVNFGHTESTCLISGWLPSDYVTEVGSRLLTETSGRLVIDTRSPEDAGASLDDVPVLMQNPKWLRPFEMLVRGFGWPRYQEVEPTLMVAVSFLIMYALMFGDVGHGAVLAIVGFIVHWRGRDETMRDIGFIVAAAGIVSILGGLMYGSFFGNEELIPFRLLSPMENVQEILSLPILIGVALISVGVILNIINHFRARHYLQGVFDRFGVVGIIFYWGALGIGLRMIFGDNGQPGTMTIVIFIAIPLAILFLRDLILSLLSPHAHSHAHEGKFTLIMHGGIDVMETLSSYLANTVSFARVGAFALAHAGLCVAVFELENIVREIPGGVIWGPLVLILGNALVIGLEGLIVFVQCLRLEYYEFFGKFFEGAGKRYAPFKTRQVR